VAQLSVQIGADIQDLLKKLKLTEAEFQKLVLKAVQSGKSVERAVKDMAKGANVPIKDLQGLSKSVDVVGKSTANAVPTLTSFSQVIQDAPYGIRGVANNITQLTSQFGYLSKSTGGASNALKAMLGSLAGPAGILFAVSAVTSLLVTYGDKLTFGASATSRLAKASREYVAEAQAEILSLKQLVDIAQDENNSKKVRQKAIDEINKNYSKYLGNLTTESINTDKVRESIDALTDSLIRQAKIKGVEDVISDITKENAGDLLELEAKRIKIQDAINKRQKNFAENVARGTDSQEQLNLNLAAQQKRLSDIDKEIDKINKSTEKALEPFLRIGETLKKEDFEIDIETSVKVDTKSQERARKEREKIERDYAETVKQINIDLANENLALTDKEFEAINAIYRASGAELADSLRINEDDIKIGNVFKTIIDDSAILKAELKEVQNIINGLGFDPNAFNLEGLNLEELDVLKDKLIDIGDQSAVLSNAISSSFGTLANSITENLKTGNEVIDSFISSIVQQLAQMLSSVIATGIKQIAVNQAVATSEAIKGGAASGAATGPGAIAAIPAFIATLVGVVTAAFAGLVVSSFAEGGSPNRIPQAGNGKVLLPQNVPTQRGGDNVLAFIKRNEVILNEEQQRRAGGPAFFGAIGVPGFASGGSFAALKNINNFSIGGFTGSISPINNVSISNHVSDGIIGEVVLRGSNQYIQLKRATKNINRFYGT